MINTRADILVNMNTFWTLVVALTFQQLIKVMKPIFCLHIVDGINMINFNTRWRLRYWQHNSYLQITAAARSLTASSGLSHSGKNGLMTQLANVSPMMALVVGLHSASKYMLDEVNAEQVGLQESLPGRVYIACLQ